MNGDNYDVIVVGGGPVGGMAAKYASRDGAHTLVIEEHKEVGLPVQCAGIISTRALEESELQPSDMCVLRSIRGAFVHSPDGNCLKVDGVSTKAYVIDRHVFDQQVVSAALDAGAELMLRSKVESLKRHDNQWQLAVGGNGEKKELTSRIIIGADGANSTVARLIGFPAPDLSLSGVQVETNYEPIDPRFVEMFSGRDVAPGFFAWAVPTTDGKARIGLCAEHKPYTYLKKLISDHPVVSKRCTGHMENMMAGKIPLGMRGRFVSDGVMLVGDAAGQVKPLSGGGIYPGMVCAKIAGRVAVEAIKKDDFSARFLKKYEKGCRRRIGRELSRGMMIRRMANSTSDADINELIDILSQPEISRLITAYGDMDHPSVLMRELFRHGGMRLTLKLLRLGLKILI